MNCTITNFQGFPGGSGVKNLPANARDTGEVDLIPGLGAWVIPWTEEPDKLQSMGPQRVRHD